MMNSSNEQILIEVSNGWDSVAAIGGLEVGLDESVTW